MEDILKSYSMWNTSFYIIISFLTRNQSTRPLVFESFAVVPPSVMADNIVFIPGWMEEGLLLGPVLISFTESCKMLKNCLKLLKIVSPSTLPNLWG